MLINLFGQLIDIVLKFGKGGLVAFSTFLYTRGEAMADIICCDHHFLPDPILNVFAEGTNDLRENSFAG